MLLLFIRLIGCSDVLSQVAAARTGSRFCSTDN